MTTLLFLSAVSHRHFQWSILFLLFKTSSVIGFVPTTNHWMWVSRSSSTSSLTERRLTPLPKGISPFEKGMAKGLDLAADFRSKASRALDQARKDGKRKLEIEFPPLLFKGKTQFDDFDNVQELDLNRDWCVEWLPSLNGKVWLILPDLKECELAKQEWQGGRYRNAAQFTTIEAATQHYTANTPTTSSSSNYRKPWGATFANGMSNLFAGGDLLGDSKALDALEGSPDIHLVCQPGNGGPVEDWINCEILHNSASGGGGIGTTTSTTATTSTSTTTVIVNGALDKVRDGYYPSIFFPALAATIDRFYVTFESILYLRPLSDKGCYGWLYRVYPEPWQVVLQTTTSSSSSQQGGTKLVVEDTVVYTSETRPSFAKALEMMVQGAAAKQKR